MKIVRGLCLFLVMFCFFFGSSCKKEKNYAELIKELPAFHLENYPFFNPGIPLAERIVPAPDFLLSHIKAMDNTDVYETYFPAEKEIAMCKEYMDLLPESYKKVLRQRLVGIYFIDNFIGSGMADFVLDKDKTIYCNLFLNPETMKHDMTTWMSMRENTCFAEDDSGIKIILECGSKYTGLMYILLHETTHIVDYVYNFTPYVDIAVKEIMEKKDGHTPFTKGVWDTYDVPCKEYNFSHRTEITFYGLGGGPKINKRDAAIMYKGCGNTPFVSLYGSKNWAEDLAEFFTCYYFTSVLDQPYEILLYNGDMLMETFKPMERENVKNRIPLFEEILHTVPEVL